MAYHGLAAAPVQIGRGLHYMGPEPTYGVLDASRARRDLGLVIDPDPGRGIALFAAALRVMARESEPGAGGPPRGRR